MFGGKYYFATFAIAIANGEVGEWLKPPVC